MVRQSTASAVTRMPARAHTVCPGGTDSRFEGQPVLLRVDKLAPVPVHNSLLPRMVRHAIQAS